MQTASINHPHAQTAVLLASFNEPDRDFVNHELLLSGTPRRLYTLARVLRAAQLMDDINAAHPPSSHRPPDMTCREYWGGRMLHIPARDLSEHLEISGAFAKADADPFDGMLRWAEQGVKAAAHGILVDHAQAV